MKPLAIRASYADLKMIKTRSVLQIILEAPIHDQEAVMDLLGGFPNPGKERWFAIAPIVLPKQAEEARAEQPRQDTPMPPSKPDGAAKREKLAWRDMTPSQQAGIRCNEPTFAAFLRETRPDDWHESMEDAEDCVRMICVIASRADLNRPEYHAQRMIWHNLDTEYQAWMRVGA